MINISGITYPYEAHGTSFVRVADNEDQSLNHDIFILGGNGRKQAKFKCIVGVGDNSDVKCCDFHYKTNVSNANATLEAINRNKNGRGITSYLLHDKTYGDCIVLFDRYDGYNVYCCATDTWLIKRAKINLST